MIDKQKENWVYTGDDPEFQGVVFEISEQSRPVGDGFFCTPQNRSCYSQAGACFMCSDGSCFVNRNVRNKT